MRVNSVQVILERIHVKVSEIFLNDGLTEIYKFVNSIFTNLIKGDSGGPFVCEYNRNVVCGIVSYGEGCGQAYKPGWLILKVCILKV